MYFVYTFLYTFSLTWNEFNKQQQRQQTKKIKYIWRTEHGYIVK